MNYDNGKIKCSLEREHIAVIRLENPPANTIDTDVLDGMNEICAALEGSNDVRAVVVTGSGKVFGGGAELKEVLSWNPEECFEKTRYGEVTYRRLENLDMPVVAAVNGYALGGGLELALSCDIRVASEKAKFGLPETSLGIVPGWGGTQRLASCIGMGKAKELIFTALRVDAAEALDLGIVQYVVAAEELEDKAFEIAEKIVNNAPLAVIEAKKLLHISRESKLDDGLVQEASAQSRLNSTEDYHEGISAFLEKRKPVWQKK